MTKTRAKLVEFIENSFRNKTLMMEEVADLLIKEGWVEVDEPLECYWCPECKFGWEPHSKDIDMKKLKHHYGCKKSILMREVVENENK